MWTSIIIWVAVLPIPIPFIPFVQNYFIALYRSSLGIDQNFTIYLLFINIIKFWCSSSLSLYFKWWSLQARFAFRWGWDVRMIRNFRITSLEFFLLDGSQNKFKWDLAHTLSKLDLFMCRLELMFVLCWNDYFSVYIFDKIHKFTLPTQILGLLLLIVL